VPAGRKEMANPEPAENEGIGTGEQHQGSLSCARSAGNL
jgi:hypothetical protein